MILLRRMEKPDETVVRRLAMKEEQNRYVSPIKKMLDKLEPGEECHLLEVDKEIVGFFIIDGNYWQKYEFSERGEIGLLGYFVDAKHQGKGLGKAGVKALKGYLESSYPTAKAVVLTVNCKNPRAIRSYLTGGFEDTGQKYYGGRAGPQYIMRMRLSKFSEESKL